ncbi:unnamed protein product [Rhizoctonia solani]|uniref:Uncharacterized protein n=1 Tax=Rhizoctonia solani TaxID=456999 RepID=A0A8H3CMJ6_9AGAM|nr:unnamed protein product [Rhizoctonia solani]
MENEPMSTTVAQVGRRPAISGGVSALNDTELSVATYMKLCKSHHQRSDKDQPAPAPDQNPAAAAAPTSTALTSSAPRGTQPQQAKAPVRSKTIDQSLTTANTPKQPTKSSVPPALLPPSAPAAPAITSTPSQSTPLEEWESVPHPNAFTEELRAKVAKLEMENKQKDVEIKSLKTTAAYYLNKSQNLENDAYRQEVLSIRRHLQVDELCEPWEITQKFGEIVRKVEDISRDMGEELGPLQPIGKHTTLDLLKLISRAPEGHSLPAATPTADLDIEDFIDFGCRALINEALFKCVLGPSVFRPGLRPEDNVFYCDLYKGIRQQESQVVAGRWRISTLKLLANHAYSPKEDAVHLCQDILLPFCSTVVDSKSCFDLIQSLLPRFEELFDRACAWNHLSRNSVVMLDFHPRYQPPGSLHDSQFTILEGRKPKPPSSKAVLLTSKLGLWSSNAVGGGDDPVYSVQTKATVLAAEYFA